MGVKIQLFECYALKPYKRYEGKTDGLLIAFIGYVKELNKLQQFKVSAQKSHHRLQCTFQLFRQ